MWAAVLEEFHQPLRVRQVDIADPAPGEVMVQVKACGLCSTDIHISEGKIPTVKLPLIPGHEFAGVVAKLGPGVTQFVPGDRVVVCVDCGCTACAGHACGTCDFCLRGETNRCLRLVRIGFERSGGMAEYANVPAGNLEKLADNIPFEQAAIVPDAVVSMYRGLKGVGGVTAGTKLVIVGVGGLGMQGIRIARLLGAHVTCTSRNDEKLELARSLGADRTINTKKVNLVDAATQLGGFDVVADLIGTRESLKEAVAACRNGGRVVALAYVDPVMEIPSYDIVIKEKQVVGSRACTRSEFREVINLVNSGMLVPHIGECVPIATVNTAMANLAAGRYFSRTVLMLPFGAA